MLDIKLNAPVLFVPERFDTVEQGVVLVVDLGSIKVDSHLIDFDPEKNYKLVNDPVMLYDAYNFLQRDMQIMTFNSLNDYHLYSTTELSAKAVKIVRDVALKLNFYNNIEQRHPMRPNYEVTLSLETMSITASDYIFKTLMRVKDLLLSKLAPPQSETL
jgi:hypothetical protein